MRDVIEQFRTAISNAGLTPPEAIEPDGTLHRFASNGKPRDDAGWYVFHGDGLPAGAFGCWRAEVSETWRADLERDLSPWEEDAHRARVKAMRLARDAEEERRRTQARARAAEIWEAAPPAPDDHAYLIRKHIADHGLRLHKGSLVVPMRSGADLHSLQFISPDGTKRFLSDGRTSGCYFLLGTPGSVLCIAEGLATGASIHEATGHAVAVAFNAGNLPAATRALHAAFPGCHLVICADDDVDVEGNPGLTKSREAAQAVQGSVAVPDFGDDRPDGATDFNDLHGLAGLAAVRDAIERAVPGKSDLPLDVPLDKATGGAARAASRAGRGLTSAPWPTPLQAEAYHGVLGDIVRALAPETEADPAAILLQLLCFFGNCVGRAPKFYVGADVHHLNLFVAIVGATAKGRKGLSRGQAQQVFAEVDSDWLRDCVGGGLSSGEGVIWSVRDPIEKEHPIREKGRVVGYERVIEDAGIADKRLMIVETEFASTLSVMGREGNTLSPVLRQAWDGQDLRTLTKTSTAKATSPHVSLIVNITSEELRRKLEATEAANGFGNRFLWVLVKRSRELPHGGRPVPLDPYTRTLGQAVTAARRTSMLRRDDAADRYWEQRYSALSAGRPGMLGSMTARAEAQVMRLACLFALADATGIIGVPHLSAAFEIWRDRFDSAAWIFGDRLGDPVADAIVAELRRCWPDSITRTQISELFQRHKTASDLNRALALLQDCKLAAVDVDRTRDGRPVERWVYVDRETSEIGEGGETTGGDFSPNSLVSPAEGQH